MRIWTENERRREGRAQGVRWGGTGAGAPKGGVRVSAHSRISPGRYGSQGLQLHPFPTSVPLKFCLPSIALH